MQRKVYTNFLPALVMLGAIAAIFGSMHLFGETTAGIPNRAVDDLRHYAEGAFEFLNADYTKKLKSEIRHIRSASRPLFAVNLLVCALAIVLLHSCLGKNMDKDKPAAGLPLVAKIWVYTVLAILIPQFVMEIEATTAFDELSSLERMPENTNHLNMLAACSRLYKAVESIETLNFAVFLVCILTSVLLIILTTACAKRQAQQSQRMDSD